MTVGQVEGRRAGTIFLGAKFATLSVFGTAKIHRNVSMEQITAKDILDAFQSTTKTTKK